MPLGGTSAALAASAHAARTRAEEGPALAVSWGGARLDAPSFWSALQHEAGGGPPPVMPAPSLGSAGEGAAEAVTVAQCAHARQRHRGGPRGPAPCMAPPPHRRVHVPHRPAPCVHRAGSGPVLGSHTELSGPGDPLLVVGSITCSGQDPSRSSLQADLVVVNRCAGSAGDGGRGGRRAAPCATLHPRPRAAACPRTCAVPAALCGPAASPACPPHRAAPRRAECDVRGAVVHALVRGPVQGAEHAFVWRVPRLSPQDRAAHTIPLKLMGWVCCPRARPCRGLLPFAVA